MKNTVMKKWDLERLFPDGLEHELQLKNEQMEALHDQIKNSNTPEVFKDFLLIVEEVQKLYSDVFAIDEYAICLSSEDVQDRNGHYSMDQSQRLKAKMETLLLTFDQYIAAIHESSWHEWIQAEELAGIRTSLMERRKQMKERLAPELEQAIHTLSMNGFEGWEDLYEQEFARLRVPVEEDGERTEMSFDMAFMKAMLSEDRSVRSSIAASIIEVCKQNQDRFALIFNHFAGFRNDLYELRGWTNPLKEMYEQNRITEASVNSMMKALHDHKHLFYQFLKRKAQIDHIAKPDWYDLYAPSFTAKTTLTYEEATEIVIKQFSRYSEKLGDFAKQAFHDGWIDAEPYENKRHGAFCASFPHAKESRVLLSFHGTYQDVVTLAHELGHAYHNTLLHEQPGFAQHAGTGLAETASTFAENLVLDAAIDHAKTEEDALSLLEMKIINGLKYTTFIPAKFEFEKDFYEKRKQGKLSSSEMIDLMEAKERDWFGNQLEQVNAYNWMSIPHFYDTEKAFYNIPYTIGYLFSNGMYSHYKEHPASFPEKYDDLLSRSGDLPMDELCAAFLGQDLSTQSFWNEAFRPLEDAIEDYLKRTENDIT
ncbi:M3 family oligoendopeptidase [Halobacillus sp. Nhm2S1]|uniref:M3 family oligoendopeptidase n=1 Tax=Halobacillus sp. Nhm2S1 TaxID=2866716 RepID=UPI001C734856|nr:M3 family oligoendopeptidase [Halobacillus sp. Nhm2S1]MBX0356136.1 M3 family oligoendopeptidase [Halobacillus sp. Nhm2S1]